MRKYIFIVLITCLIIATSLIKKSTRDLENKIFSVEEKIKTLGDKKEMAMLQNNYLSSPQRLFELKNEFFGEELKVLELKNFKYLNFNEKR
tara:strand:+ start:1917 stop:2189 length:273 start_codon:yes stop_codon:yes gene_type:complete